MGALSTALSLLGVVLYIVAIIALAAFVTWAVVKLFPPKTAAQKAAARSSRD
jgi:flagellar biogenesis protein FliO